jgi:hypothetical protein
LPAAGQDAKLQSVVFNVRAIMEADEMKGAPLVSDHENRDLQYVGVTMIFSSCLYSSVLFSATDS